MVIKENRIENSIYIFLAGGQREREKEGEREWERERETGGGVNWLIN